MINILKFTVFIFPGLVALGFPQVFFDSSRTILFKCRTYFQAKHLDSLCTDYNGSVPYYQCEISSTNKINTDGDGLIGTWSGGVHSDPFHEKAVNSRCGKLLEVCCQHPSNFKVPKHKLKPCHKYKVHTYYFISQRSTFKKSMFRNNFASILCFSYSWVLLECMTKWLWYIWVTWVLFSSVQHSQVLV